MRFWTVFGHPKPIIRNPKYDPLVVSQRVHSDKRSTSSYMNLDTVTSLRENRDFPTQVDDSRLAGVVDAWPGLPEAIRAGIVAYSSGGESIIDLDHVALIEVDKP